MYLHFKRFLDICLSLLMLVPLSVVLFIVGIAIKIEDGGPVFYSGERLGRKSKVFKMYKFRSMKVNAPDVRNQDGSTFNSKNDPRLTKVGKFIRETSIDEIPQLLNVLKGDMSIIGPRASVGNALSTFKKDELDKMKVRPGITGYTQAYFRNSLNMREKRLKDVWYANNVTFILDLKIFFKTIQTVLKKEDLYTNNVNELNNKEKV